VSLICETLPPLQLRLIAELKELIPIPSVILTSGLFGLILEIVTEGAPPQVISEVALLASIMLFVYEKNSRFCFGVDSSEFLWDTVC
jgi:hypothetical protein